VRDAREDVMEVEAMDEDGERPGFTYLDYI